MKTLTDTKIYVQAVEDNSGGLSLYISDYESDKFIFAQSGYEFAKGNLKGELEYILAHGFEYDKCKSNNNYGLVNELNELGHIPVSSIVIAEICKGVWYQYNEDMGVQGKEEFGIE